MRTVDYITVLKGAADLSGLDRNSISTDEQARFRQWASKRLATAWEFHFWPEICRVEERTPTDRLIEYDQGGETPIGHCFGAFDRDPRRYFHAAEIGFVLTDEGVLLAKDTDPAWLHFRLVTPELNGAVFSASATYDAPEQVYFSSADVPGNFYDCLSATSAGQSPATHPAKWAVVEIPRIFQRYLEHAMFADYLTAEGQVERAGSENARADRLLSQQSKVLAAQQNQRQRTVVLTR